MKRACLQQNTNTYEQNHASSIRPLKINFVRMKFFKMFLVVIHLIAWIQKKQEK